MKNLILKFIGKKISIFLLIIITALNNSIISQTNYPIPENFGDERVAEFYPIGWSKSANFAYMVTIHQPFRGSFWTLIIQNTKSDKILYSLMFDGDLGTRHVNNPSESWQHIYRKTRRYLDKYKIEPQREFYKFREISARRGYEYRVSYRKVSGVADMSYSTDDEEIIETVGFRVKVSNDYGSKTITKNYKNYSGEFIDNIAFFGAIESPFEDRIVVITSFETYDYQGDAAGTALAIAGCKLNTGFK